MPVPLIKAIPSVSIILLSVLAGLTQLPSLGDSKGPLTRAENQNRQAEPQRPGPGQMQKRVQSGFMDFPQGRSLGTIYTLPKVWNPLVCPIPWTFFAQAKGRVRVPPGTQFAFSPNGLIGEQPQYLGQFLPGTLLSLELIGLDISDGLLSKVGHLADLRRIDLNDTDIDDAGLRNLKDLKHLQFLSISKTLIKGPGLSNLQTLKELQFLNLSGNCLARGSIKHLIVLPVLCDLELCHCLLTDDDLADVAKINSLTDLNLSFNNGITDSGIKALEGSKHLAVLNLDETHVTAGGLLALKGFPFRIISLPSACHNKIALTVLHKAFPNTTLNFSNRNTYDSVEFFDPGHRLPR
jgi:hypothetical protein